MTKKERRYKKYRNQFAKRMSGRHAQYVARFIHHHGRRTDWGLQFLYGGLPTCNPSGKYSIHECFYYDSYLERWKSEGTFTLSREGYYRGEPMSPAWITRRARDRHQTDQAYA